MDDPGAANVTAPGKNAGRTIAWAIAALAAAGVTAGTLTHTFYGDTLNSRLATVYALVHEGTFIIETPGTRPSNPFAGRTVDKVQFDGRIVSSKPPLLPLLMTAEYLVVRSVFGWDLDDPDDVDRVSRIMALSFIGAPFVLMVWVLARTVQSEFGNPAATAFAGIATLAGTHAAAYAVTFNNHVPAAAAVVVCFALTLDLLCADATAARWKFIVFGIAAGVAVTMDVPTAVFPALFGMLLARRHIRSLILWSLPFAGFLLGAQTIALLMATGSPLPVQMHPEAYLYENSYWRNPLGVDAINDPFFTYLFHITVGRVGIFSMFPISLLAIPGIILSTRAGRPFAAITACTVAGAVVLAVYYAYSTNNYGGSAFGFRWFIVLGPLLVLLAAPAIARFSRPWQWGVSAILLGVSAYSAWSGYTHPWEPNHEWTVRLFGPGL